MVNENRSLRWLVILMWALAIVPSLVALLTEANKTHLVWYIRIVDLVDLVIVAPFYLAALLSLHALIVCRDRRLAFWLGFALIGAFMYGHAMHLAANAVSTYSTEIRDYASIIPSDSYALLHFFDEDLGHWILFAAYYGLLGVWLWEDRFTGVGQILTILPGILLGIALAIAVVESSHPWVAMVGSVFLLALGFLRSRREHGTSISLWKTRPVSRFVMAGAIAAIITELLYWFIVGGFVQPSELCF